MVLKNGIYLIDLTNDETLQRTEKMQAEINNENKAKFFALYLNQKVLCDNLRSNERLDKSWNWSHKDFWIQLKPLSSISDEDKDAVGLEPCHQFDEKGWYERSTFDELFYYWSFEDVDYLRSKGYALPWMGLSVDEMVKSGWIKLIES